MIDKYDTLQDKLGFDIRELNEYKYAQRLRNEVKMKETYKVKLKDTRVGKKPHITIISMEKEGKILHILEDKTKEL